MTLAQSAVTIGAVVLGTVLTRCLPFWLFPDHKTPPPFITYLGTVLPNAAIGLLVVYALKDAWGGPYHGGPELIALVCVVLLHRWKKNTLLSIGGGTALYMFLVQVLFV